MPTPKKRKPYNIIYTDQTYQTFELTREDLEILTTAWECKGIAGISGDVFLATTDIRTIVPFVAPPEPPKQDAPTIPEELDDASKEWLRDNTSYYYEEGRSS